MPIYNGMLPVITKDEVKKRYAGLRQPEVFQKNSLTKLVKKSNY